MNTRGLVVCSVMSRIPWIVVGWVAPSVPLPTCILTDTDCLPPYFILVLTIKGMIVICVLCVCHTLVGQCYI